MKIKRIIALLQRGFLQWWRQHLQNIDRQFVEDRVSTEGGLSYSYIFLVFTSCAIATLGLLLNSAAVIIGAMLIAPLMGPIVLLGLAIAKTDVLLVIRASKALAIGIVGALMTAALIVKLAPFIPPTQEILARTNPNLFDLLVAIVSGLVAGYAVIRQQGGTFAGVAIATALMPPLAVSGYGFATANMAIFSGAFFLFLSNMLAIAFSVTFMASWYGLGNLRTKRELAWKTLGAAAALAALSIPLVQTLNESVSKTILSNQVENILRAGMDKGKSRLDRLEILTDGEGGKTVVNAVILTQRYDKEAEAKLQKDLSDKLGDSVQLHLDQIVANLEIPKSQPTVSPAMLAARQEELLGKNIAEQLRVALPMRAAIAEIDSKTKSAKFLAVAGEAGTPLSAIKNAEGELKRKFPDWSILLIPPFESLPSVSFEAGSVELSKDGQDELDSILWALERWGNRRVHITGFAALREKGKNTPGLAFERAGSVAKILAGKGFEVTQDDIYPAPQQSRKESEMGAAAFRKAIVTIESYSLLRNEQEASPGEKSAQRR